MDEERAFSGLARANNLRLRDVSLRQKVVRSLEDSTLEVKQTIVKKWGDGTDALDQFLVTLACHLLGMFRVIERLIS